MKEQLWKRVIAVLLVSGIVTSGMLIVYTVKLHQQCSIITYISNESE